MLVVVLLILMIILTVGLIIYYTHLSKKDTTKDIPVFTPKTSSDNSFGTNNVKPIYKDATPEDATCRGEIQDSYYTFSNESKLGSDILKELNISHVKEGFALSPNLVLNATDLKQYYVEGLLNTSNTLKEAKNGGLNNCPTFPNKIYKISCPAGKTYNGSSCTCPTTCSANATQNSDCSCKCNNSCPSNSTQNSDCSCNCKGTCSVWGQTMDTNCNCTCPSGQKLIKCTSYGPGYSGENSFCGEGDPSNYNYNFGDEGQFCNYALLNF